MFKSPKAYTAKELEELMLLMKDYRVDSLELPCGLKIQKSQHALQALKPQAVVPQKPAEEPSEDELLYYSS